MALVTAFYNNKGGVGKTTVTYNLAYLLSLKGYKVLMIDSDAQANLTNSFLSQEKSVDLDGFYEMMMGYKKSTDCIYSLKENLYLMPSKIEVSELDIELTTKAVTGIGIQKEMILRNGIESIKDNYDYILIDSNPSMSLVNINVLSCSDYYVIPCQLENYALRGVLNIYKFVNKILRVNPNLKLLGCLGTFLDKRKNLNDECLEMLKEHFKDNLFKIVISDNVKVSQASSNYESIYQCDRNIQASKDFIELTDEFIARISSNE